MKHRIGWKIYIFSVFFLLISIGFISSCSDLQFNGQVDCLTDDDCAYRGDTKLLYKNPIDLLIVLDNSKKAKDINPHIVANLDQFLQCMKPLGWKVGLVSGVYNRSESESFGQLIHTEINGLLSNKNSLTQHDENYAQIFHNTVSLQSGCASPPFCYDGKLQPLSAIKSFMENQQENKPFLREQTPLSTIVISSSEKQKKPAFSSAAPASSQELVAFLRQGYYRQQRHLMGLAVLPPGTAQDCVPTKGDVLFNGAKELNRMGQAYALNSANPMAFLASAIIEDIIGLFHKNEKVYEIALFAQQTGGKVVDLCSQHFGKALAYLIFQKLKVPNKFPEECRTL